MPLGRSGCSLPRIAKISPSPSCDSMTRTQPRRRPRLPSPGRSGKAPRGRRPASGRRPRRRPPLPSSLPAAAPAHLSHVPSPPGLFPTSQQGSHTARPLPEARAVVVRPWPAGTSVPLALTDARARTPSRALRFSKSLASWDSPGTQSVHAPLPPPPDPKLPRYTEEAEGESPPPLRAPHLPGARPYLRSCIH